MSDTLKYLRIFFSAICQFFLYRIFQATMADIFNIESEQSNAVLRGIVTTLFYFSEMIMFIGICISIKKSVVAATH